MKLKDPKTGEIYEGELVRAVKLEEPFSRAELEDGTIIQIRTTFVKFIRHVDKWDDNGNPQYTIDAGTSVSIIPNPELKKEKAHGVG